jgi:hypothetical protein
MRRNDGAIDHTMGYRWQRKAYIWMGLVTPRIFIYSSSLTSCLLSRDRHCSCHITYTAPDVETDQI